MDPSVHTGNVTLGYEFSELDEAPSLKLVGAALILVVMMHFLT